MRLSDISAVKVLGRSIGFVGKPSEVDGDGDGFLTGPDGRDNVPAPKAVVEAAKKAGRVADILQPTDDLFEVRKSGRPWRPLVFDELPEDFKKDFRKLYDDAARHMYEKGRKWSEVERRLVKQFGGGDDDFILDRFGTPTQWARDNVPSDELNKYADIASDYLLGKSGDRKFDKDAELLQRMSELDDRYLQFLNNAFKQQREKAIAAGKGDQFDKSFKGFGKSLSDVKQRMNFATTMIASAGGLSVLSAAWATGRSGKKWDDPFQKADEEASKLVNNPRKRIVAYVDGDLLGTILKDGRMKNFFEAKRNVFNDSFKELEAYDKWGAKERRQSYMMSRLRGEQFINGIPSVGFQGKNRPIYAMLFPDGFHSIDEKPDGPEFRLPYGDVAIVMRHSVEDRATFTAADGLNQYFYGASPINKPSGISMIPKRFSAYSADERREAMKKPFDPIGRGFDYTEAQIMGGVTVNDIAYVAVRDEKAIPEQIKQRLKEMGIPMVVHSSTDTYKEPEELSQKQDDASGGYVLFATWGKRKLFVPSNKPKDDDMHGMISMVGGKRQRVENVASIMKFGNWEMV